MSRTLNFLKPLVLLGLAGFMLTGCDRDGVTEKDIQQQKEKIADAKDELVNLEKRKEVEGQMEAKLEELQSKIDALKKQADNASGDEEVKLNGRIAELQTKHEQGKKQLNELRAASGHNWATLKIKSQKSWDAISDSVDSQVKEWKEPKDADDSTNNDFQPRTNGEK